MANLDKVETNRQTGNFRLVDSERITKSGGLDIMQFGH